MHEVETLTYANEVPWHGLGTPLPAEGLRDWRVACKTAGLDWTVEPRPLYLSKSVEDSEGFLNIVLGDEVTHKANVRTSDNKVLGVVGPDYEVLQNEDAFKWFEPFLQSGEVTIEVAGALRGGTRIFALAKIDGAIQDVRKDDPVQRYILLSHSHDGSLAVRAGLTDIRVVCHNTLTLAHGSAGSKLIRLRHTKNVKTNLEAVREVLDATRRGFFATLDQYRKLADKGINASDVRRYVEIVLDVRRDKDGEIHKRTADRIDQIVNLAFSGRGNTGSSVWDAYNAVTEYTSWERGRSSESRVNSVWFGDSAKLNQKALDVALAFAA